MTEEQAKALFATRFWEEMPPAERSLWQLHERRLCMPFELFHEGVEKILGRSVWTHEFADPERLLAEYYGARPRPTMQEIIGLLPADKRVILVQS